MNANERPNVLLIMTDAQRRDTLGCYGNRLVRTPAIDSLAAEGVRFAEWHVPNPLCMGVRASLMTGHYPSSHGVRTNGMNLGDAPPAIAGLLADAGYWTASVGKLHLNLWLADKPGHSQEGRADWAAGRRRIDLPYFGFQAVDAAIGHNEYIWGPYVAWLAEACPDGYALMQPENALRPPSGAHRTWDSALPAEFHCTNWVADRTIARLRARDAGRPFFLVASFPDPHMSYSPPAPYCRMYDPADVPPPLWRDGELDRIPPHFRAYYEGTGYCREMFADEALNMRPAAAHTEHQWRDMLAHHWGQVTLIDDAVGRILAALDEQGLRENTVVIFTTDHGALMGDHGMHMHGPFHYDGQLRIPAIWRWPGRFPAGRVSRALASTVDVAPTLLALAGIAAPAAMQGASLAAVLGGDEAAWARQAVVTEYDDELFGPFFRTVTTHRWKLTRYAGQPYGELFDRDEDPDEFHNLYDDPGYGAIRAELGDLLLDEMLKLGSTRLERLALHA